MTWAAAAVAAGICAVGAGLVPVQAQGSASGEIHLLPEEAAGFDALPAGPEIPLPIGISFFTFQAVSYLIDVYRREIPAAASYGEFAVYHSLFPQLVAGPIVRYREVRSEMRFRRVDRRALTEGAYRFCIGLGKKMVLADNLGTVADSIFALPVGGLGCGHAWLGVFCYSLQIYFDFGGYSNMAIGLGLMIGFTFPINLYLAGSQ